MLEKEFQYYLQHQKELVKKYDNRYLVITNEEVVGNYDNFANAVSEAEQNYKPGTFLVQKCSEGEKDYTVKYHSRVRIPHESEL